MNAVTIGPLVFAPDRFATILAIAAFMFVTGLLGRRVDSRFSDWGWKAVLLFVVGARLGHVLWNIESFAAEPFRAFAIWQGGFSIEAGIAASAAYTAFHFHRDIFQAAWTLLPAASAAFTAVFVIQLTAGTPQTPLPQGSFFTLSGDPVEPGSLAGRPLVINLWATWCPPCRREMPMMADVAAMTEETSFVFVNQGEGMSAIRAYLESENIELQNVLLDSLGQFGRNYAVPGLPATLFIGSDGLLRSVHVGEISRETLLSGVARLD